MDSIFVLRFQADLSTSVVRSSQYVPLRNVDQNRFFTKHVYEDYFDPSNLLGFGARYCLNKTKHPHAENTSCLPVALIVIQRYKDLGWMMYGIPEDLKSRMRNNCTLTKFKNPQNKSYLRWSLIVMVTLDSDGDSG